MKHCNNREPHLGNENLCSGSWSVTKYLWGFLWTWEHLKEKIYGGATFKVELLGSIF